VTTAIAKRGPLADAPRIEPLRARFLSAASWSLAGAVASRGLTLVGSILAARLLGTAAFGALGIVQCTAGMFVAVAGLGLGLTATKHVAECRDSHPDRAGRLIGLLVMVTAVSGLVLSLLFALSIDVLAWTIPDGRALAGELRLATGLVFFGALNGTLLGILAGFEAFRSSANVGVVRGGLGAALMLAGMSARGVPGGVAGLVVAEAIAALATCAAVGREARAKGVRVGWPVVWAEWPVLWRFGLPALLSSVAILPVMWAGNVLLVRWGGGFDQVGLFAAAGRWGQLILFLPSSISGIVLPMLANSHGSRDRARFRSLFNLNVVVNLAVTVPPLAALALLARPAMRLYGEDYERGWPIVIALALGALPTVLNNVLGQAVISAGSIWCRVAIDLLLAAMLAAGALWLVPRHGAVGLAIAHGLAYSASSLVLLWLSWRQVWRVRHARPFLA